MKKALKIIGIIVAVAGVATAIYFAVKKYLEKKNQEAGHTLCIRRISTW